MQRRLGTLILGALAGAAFLVAAGFVDTQLGWRDNAARAIDLPIIFLTARDSEFDAVSGLRLGADGWRRGPGANAPTRGGTQPGVRGSRHAFAQPAGPRFRAGWHASVG